MWFTIFLCPKCEHEEEQCQFSVHQQVAHIIFDETVEHQIIAGNRFHHLQSQKKELMYAIPDERIAI